MTIKIKNKPFHMMLSTKLESSCLLLRRFSHSKLSASVGLFLISRANPSIESGILSVDQFRWLFSMFIQVHPLIVQKFFLEPSVSLLLSGDDIPTHHHSCISPCSSPVAMHAGFLMAYQNNVLYTLL